MGMQIGAIGIKKWRCFARDWRMWVMNAMPLFLTLLSFLSFTNQIREKDVN
jgi:hypothetical protein